MIVVSCGDPGGIGGEILLKALAAGASDLPVLLALPFGLARAWLGVLQAPREWQPRVWHADAEPPEKGLWCLPDEPGWPAVRFPAAAAVDAHSGLLAWRSLERAVDLVLENPGQRALVTAPIHKLAMHEAGFRWPGHTEYLEERGGKGPGLMWMHGPRLSVGLLCNHLPIKDVAAAVTASTLAHKIRLACAFLRDHGIDDELRVLGLDPHAGDGGAIGTADRDLLAPCIAGLRAGGLPASGPWPADAALARGHGRFLAMYHDQGLPVFKLVEGGQGVNLTLGLPFVRVSPDHGTAFDIAGKGQADPASMITALATATRLLRARNAPRKTEEPA